MTDLTTFHEYADAPELGRMCAAMNELLKDHGGRSLFLPPIEGGGSGNSSDPGSQHKPGAPVLCTEFGGVNIAPARNGPAAGDSDWGYTTASDAQDLLRRLENLVTAIVSGGHCCGFVYTQL